MIIPNLNAPENEQVLIARVNALAGLTIQQLADKLSITIPTNILYAKGFIGQLLEIALGATAGSKSKPDFEHLGIELKTIPIGNQAKVLETTYVCTVPLQPNDSLNWRDSVVYHKLARVLWIPIQGDVHLPIGQRMIGTGWLWQMLPAIEIILRQDWEELMEQIALGLIEDMTAKQGTYLQIRPKAANSRAKTHGINREGQTVLTMPKGFYLRTQFTQMLISQQFG